MHRYTYRTYEILQYRSCSNMMMSSYAPDHNYDDSGYGSM